MEACSARSSARPSSASAGRSRAPGDDAAAERRRGAEAGARPGEEDRRALLDLVGHYLEPGAVDALAFLEARPDSATAARCADREIAVRRFHDEGGRHADLHLKNLLIRESGDTAECIIIDLDKARITPASPTTSGWRES
jgi:hypothetical protein